MFALKNWICHGLLPITCYNKLQLNDSLVSEELMGTEPVSYNKWKQIHRGNPTNLKQEEVLTVLCNFEEKW